MQRNRPVSFAGEGSSRCTLIDAITLHATTPIKFIFQNERNGVDDEHPTSERGFVVQDGGVYWIGEGV
jgi:hypothetical protein